MVQIGVFTVMLPHQHPREAAALLAGAGYDGVEWRVKGDVETYAAEAPSFWRNNRCTFTPTREAGAEGRRIAEAAGLAMPGFTPYVEVDDEAGLEAALEFAQGARLGQFRLQTALWREGLSYADEFRRTVAFWSKAVERARPLGVRLLAETHHSTIGASVSLAMRVLRNFPTGAVGLLFDPGNLVKEGYEDYGIGLELAGEYLAHVHIKNANYRPGPNGVWLPEWAPLGDGVLDIGAVFRALKRVGYDGWLCVEDFSNPDPSAADLAHTAGYLRAAWEDAR